MKICTVIGNVWATKKEESLNGLKLMVVREDREDRAQADEPSFVAADMVGAGVGEQVLVVGGSTARHATGSRAACVDAAIVGIIDTLEVDKAK